MTVSSDLSGRVVAITGASRGLGATAAKTFAQAGARVALLARTERHLEQQAAAIGPAALPIVADVGNPDDVRRTFARIEEEFGRLDILINNAGSSVHTLIEEATDEEIASAVAANLLGPIYTTRAATPLMRRAGGGHILNVSTEATLFPESPYLGLYVATKAGLDMLSRVSYQELKPLGIRVTLIVPGAMQPREPGVATAERARRDPQHLAKVIQALQASGHRELLGGGNPAYCEDVADAMLYAVTTSANYAIDVIRVRPFPQSPTWEDPTTATTL